MRNKKVIICVIAAFTILGIGLGYSIGNSRNKKGSYSGNTTVTTQIDENDEKREDNEPFMQSKKECEGVVKQYLRIMKTDNGKDGYLQKFEKVKSLLSKDLYEILRPKESAPGTYKSKIYTDVEVLDTASSNKKEDMTEVWCLYSVRVSVDESTTAARYLFRSTVKEENGNYTITSIIEDSRLDDGIYQR